MKLLGHQKQWQFLRESYRLGKLPHAFLFQGPEKAGKKTLAKEFVKLINCQAPEFSQKPCQKCLSCQTIEKGIHPDFVFIEPTGPVSASYFAKSTSFAKVTSATKAESADKKASTGKGEIQISQIRDLSLKLAEKPSFSQFKTAILDQVHLMNQEAQNSFLKTLEEPKGNTILILITEYPERLLPTILSRVQKIKFYPPKKEEIENFLKEKGFTKEEIEEILIISLGKIGTIIDFSKNPEKLKERKEKIKEMIKIINSPLFSRFQYAKELSQKDDLKEILDIWLNYFRKILLSKVNPVRSKTPKAFAAHLVRTSNGVNGKIITSQYSVLKTKEILYQIEKINFLLSTTNINKKLALEMLMLEI